MSQPSIRKAPNYFWNKHVNNAPCLSLQWQHGFPRKKHRMRSWESLESSGNNQAWNKLPKPIFMPKVGKSVLYSGEEYAESICCACDCLDGTEEDRNAATVTRFKGRCLALPRKRRTDVVQTGIRADRVQWSWILWFTFLCLSPGNH